MSRHLFDKGLEYTTINLHRSAISESHAGFDGQPIGSHPLVRQALRSVFRQRAPLPKYTHTFDISPVLRFISCDNSSLSLQQLTKKALLLIIYSTFSRMSSVARLGPTVTENIDHVILHLFTLEKQARPGNVRGYIPIPKFEDPLLCPARTILYYIDKASLFFPFITFIYLSLLDCLSPCRQCLPLCQLEKASQECLCQDPQSLGG